MTGQPFTLNIIPSAFIFQPYNSKQNIFIENEKRHDLALGCVDKILAADPNFPEALFVKAQILWEGNQDAAATKQCLIHLMKAEPDKDDFEK